MAAPPQCWSHYRCNLRSVRPPEKAGSRVKRCSTVLTVCWFVVWFFLCISSVSASSKAVLGGPVPCHSLAGTWTGSDWGAAWHHAEDQSYGSEGRHCSAPPCSGCRRRRRAGCSSWSFRGGMCRWAAEGGTNKERRKCWFTACKTGSSGTIMCAERTAEHFTFCCSVEVQQANQIKSTPQTCKIIYLFINFAKMP